MEKYYPDFYWQMKAQLVREIRDAQIWSDKVDTYLALLNINRVGKAMMEEAKHLSGGNTDTDEMGPHKRRNRDDFRIRQANTKLVKHKQPD
ncbi:MAG: hypothetical protein ABIJ40_03330 [Bacteroidota bacterium]